MTLDTRIAEGACVGRLAAIADPFSVEHIAGPVPEARPHSAVIRKTGVGRPGAAAVAHADIGVRARVPIITGLDDVAARLRPRDEAIEGAWVPIVTGRARGLALSRLGHALPLGAVDREARTEPLGAHIVHGAQVIIITGRRVGRLRAPTDAVTARVMARVLCLAGIRRSATRSARA